MKLKNIEVIFYIILLVLISIWGIPYLYLCKNYASQFIVENPNTFFSFKISIITILYLVLLSAPFLSIFIVTRRLLKFPDLLETSVAYVLISLIYLYLYINIQVHKYWFSPDIIDVLFNDPLSKLGDSISNNFIILIVLKLIGLIIIFYFFVIFYFGPFAFLFLVYKKISHHKYFNVSVSLFILSVISYLLVELTCESSNNLITNGITFDFNKSYLVDIYILVILIITLTIYFYFISPLLSYLMCVLLMKDVDYLSDKLRFLKIFKLNVFYILFIFSLNISLGKMTTLNFSKIPTAYPGEILKSDEELEMQEYMNDLQDDYPR
jgi:hypothetical protein